MEAFVTRLLTMSLGGACVIAATLLIRLPLRKAPHKWAVLLWTLAALRLICPFTFSSDAALTPDVKTLLPEAAVIEETPETPVEEAKTPAAPGQPLPQTPAPGTAAPGQTDSATPGQAGTLSPAQSGTQQTETPQAGTQSPAGPAGTGQVPAAEPAGEEVPAVTKTAPSLPTVLFAVWAAGAGAMLVYAAASYLRLLRKTRARIKTAEGVYVCDALPGPFVLGAVKPKVFLPSDLPDDVSAAVLAHEKAHLRRRDPLVKLLGFFILTLHWFNPFVWAAYLLLGRDLELAADEEALARADAEGRKRYASALLECALPKRGLSMAPLGFGEIGVRQRIKNMSVKKKLGAGLAILLLLAAGAVCVFLMTDKKPDSPAEPPADGLAITGETDSFPEGEIALTLTLENKSDRAVLFGSSAGDLPAHLEVKGGDGSWTPILTDLVWFADAEILQPHDSAQKTVSLQGRALSPGEYRLDVGWRDAEDRDAAFSHAYFTFTVTALEGGLRLTGDNDVIAYGNRVINVTATNGSGDRLTFGSMPEGQEPPAIEKQTEPGVWETLDHHAFSGSIDITSLSIMSPGETRSFSVYAGDLLYSPGEYRLRLAYYKANENPAETRPRYAYLPFTVPVPERTVLRENDPTVMLRADEPEDAGPAFAAAKDCLLKRVLQRFGAPDGDPLAESIFAVRDDPALAGLAAKAADILQRDERPFYADPALGTGGLQAFFDNLSVYEKGNAYFDRRRDSYGWIYPLVDVGYSLLESAEEDGVAVLVIYEALDYRETSRISASFMGSRYTVTLFSVGGVWRVAALESDYLLNRGGYQPENYETDEPADPLFTWEALSDAEFEALLDGLFVPSDRFTNEELSRLPANERARFSSVQRFFTSYYADPRDMDLGLFLRYLDECRNSDFADPGSPNYSPETAEILKKELPEDEPSPEALPVHLYDLDELNAYLYRYLGITVEEMRRDWLHPTDEYYSVESALFPEETEIRMPGFLPSLNAFYTRTSDWVGGTFLPVGATRDGDRICLYGEKDYALLRQTDTGLRIEAFLPFTTDGADVYQYVGDENLLLFSDSGVFLPRIETETAAGLTVGLAYDDVSPELLTWMKTELDGGRLFSTIYSIAPASEIYVITPPIRFESTAEPGDQASSADGEPATFLVLSHNDPVAEICVGKADGEYHYSVITPALPGLADLSLLSKDNLNRSVYETEGPGKSAPTVTLSEPAPNDAHASCENVLFVCSRSKTNGADVYQYVGDENLLLFFDGERFWFTGSGDSFREITDFTGVEGTVAETGNPELFTIDGTDALLEVEPGRIAISRNAGVDYAYPFYRVLE